MEKSALAWDNHGIRGIVRLGLALLVGLVIGEDPTVVASFTRM
jgi:hypothetical protein